ncbi:unnamed protein product [Aphanomyces euteiches]
MHSLHPQRDAAAVVHERALSTSINSIIKEEHLLYGIMVQYLDRRWVIYKRYSEFRRLRESLLTLTSAAKCTCRCLHLPLSSLAFPKKKLFSTKSDQVASERRASLGRFLDVTLTLLGNSMLECEATDCPIVPLLKTFLQVQRHTHMMLTSTSVATDTSFVRKTLTTKRYGGEEFALSSCRDQVDMCVLSTR